MLALLCPLADVAGAPSAAIPAVLGESRESYIEIIKDGQLSVTAYSCGTGNGLKPGTKASPLLFFKLGTLICDYKIVKIPSHV